MAQIQVTDLTFSYDGNADEVLKDVSFNIDTDWKLGLIGRNGKGKTTLLNLFMGKYDYRGSIRTTACFDYFPYQVSLQDLKKTAEDLIEFWKPQIELWQVLIHANNLSLRYDGAENELFDGLRFQVKQGERVILTGENGCGKSSILKAILHKLKSADTGTNQGLSVSGELDAASGMVVSYVS